MFRITRLARLIHSEQKKAKFSLKSQITCTERANTRKKTKISLKIIEHMQKRADTQLA